MVMMVVIVVVVIVVMIVMVVMIVVMLLVHGKIPPWGFFYIIVLMVPDVKAFIFSVKPPGAVAPDREK